MPSVIHSLYAYLLPRVRRAAELESEEIEFARLSQRQATLTQELRPALTPRFSERFTVTREEVAPGFVSWTMLPRKLAAAGVASSPGAAGSGPAVDTVIHVHGGSFVSGIDPAHLRFAGNLAERLGVRMVLPDYPLSPRYTWRDSHAPGVDLIERWCGAPGRVVLMGDSAGAGLGLACALTLRDRARVNPQAPQPDRLVLLSPWVDLTTSTPETLAAAAVDPWLKLSKVRYYAKLWAGSEADLGRPEVSPALADLRDLPPALLMYGTRDVLAPGAQLLARRAAAADWDLRSLEAPHLIHDFMFFPGLPEAKRAFETVARFINSGRG